MSLKVQLFEGASILISKVFGLILFGPRSGHLFSYIIISIVIFDFLKIFYGVFIKMLLGRPGKETDNRRTGQTERWDRCSRLIGRVGQWNRKKISSWA